MPFEIFNEEKLDFLCQEKKAEWGGGYLS